MFDFFCYLKFRGYFFNDMYSKKELSLKKKEGIAISNKLMFVSGVYNSFYNKNKNRVNIN